MEAASWASTLQACSGATPSPPSSAVALGHTLFAYPFPFFDTTTQPQHAQRLFFELRTSRSPTTRSWRSSHAPFVILRTGDAMQDIDAPLAGCAYFPPNSDPASKADEVQALAQVPNRASHPAETSLGGASVRVQPQQQQEVHGSAPGALPLAVPDIEEAHMASGQHLQEQPGLQPGLGMSLLGRRILSVTHITGSLWCQLQALFREAHPTMQRETRAMRRGKRAHRALEHHAIRGKVTVTRGVAAHTSHHTARQTFEAMCIAAAPVAWAGAEPGTARAMGPLRAGLCMDAALQAGGVVHANCVGNVRTVAEAAEVAAAQHCLAGTFDQRPKKRACTEASIGPAAATPAAPRAWKATGAGAAAAYDLAGAAVQAVVPPVPVQAAPSVHHAPDTSAADQPHALLTRDHGLPATLTAAAAPTAAAAAAGVIAGMTDAAAAALAPPPRTFRGCSKDSQASQAAVRVSVAVSTREDRWAISALDSVSSLHTLAREGSTREVFLFGQVAGVPVVGYADCLRLLQLHPERDDDDDARAGGMVDVALLHAVQQQQEQQQQRQEVLVAGSRNAIRDMQACKEAGALQVRDRRMVQKRMRVVEDKFRGSCHGLSGPQLESAVLQAMLYHAMLLQMRTATLPSIAHAWLRTAGLLPSAPLSRAVQRFASRLGLGRPANCMDVMAMVQDAFAVLPRMDECIQLQVRVGQAAVSIQSQRITYDESWMLERAVPQIAVWRGQRAPQGVQMQDMHYKCGKCSYACLCPAAKAAGKDVF